MTSEVKSQSAHGGRGCFFRVFFGQKNNALLMSVNLVNPGYIITGLGFIISGVRLRWVGIVGMVCPALKCYQVKALHTMFLMCPGLGQQLKVLPFLNHVLFIDLSKMVPINGEGDC